VTLHLIVRVEAVAFHQAFGQAQRHGGVVRPLAGLKVEWAATDNRVQGRESSGWLKLDSGAQCITGCKP
jgi:hypothetical protein